MSIPTSQPYVNCLILISTVQCFKNFTIQYEILWLQSLKLGDYSQLFTFLFCVLKKKKSYNKSEEENRIEADVFCLLTVWHKDVFSFSYETLRYVTIFSTVNPEIRGNMSLLHGPLLNFSQSWQKNSKISVRTTGWANQAWMTKVLR